MTDIRPVSDLINHVEEKLDEADKLAELQSKRLSHDEVFGKVRASQLLKANKTPVLRDK